MHTVADHVGEIDPVVGLPHIDVIPYRGNLVFEIPRETNVEDVISDSQQQNDLALISSNQKVVEEDNESIATVYDESHPILNDNSDFWGYAIFNG